jgi:tetrapyrrole methylase family protein/MazG family protein
MKSFDDLLKLADILLGENGCPWDKKQTIFTLQKHLIEEAHEVIEAIDSKDYDHIKEELGDLLYSIIFIAKVAEKEGKFSVDELTDELYKKYVRRHPHIFGEEKLETSEEVVKAWDKIKTTEKKKNTSSFPPTLPLLLKAQKIIKKLEKQSKIEEILKDKPKDPEGEIASKIFNIIVDAEKEETNVEDALRRYLDHLVKKYEL